MSFSDIRWEALASAISVVAVVLGVLLMVLRSQFGAIFVTRTEFKPLSERVDAVEKTMSRMPTHSDFNALDRRLSEVNASVAAINAFVAALKDDTQSIKHQLNMLIEAKLTEERRS